MLVTQGERIPSPPTSATQGPCSCLWGSEAAPLLRDWAKATGDVGMALLMEKRQQEPSEQPGGLLQEPSWEEGEDGSRSGNRHQGKHSPHFAGQRGSKEELRAEKSGKERQREGKEGSVALSLSLEHHCL